MANSRIRECPQKGGKRALGYRAYSRRGELAGDMAGRRLDGQGGGRLISPVRSPQAQEGAPPRGAADGVEVLVVSQDRF